MRDDGLGRIVHPAGVTARPIGQYGRLADGLQDPGGRVPPAHRDRGLQLVQHIGVAARGVEREMARPGTGPQRRLAVRPQLPGFRVEHTDPYGVGAEVDAEHPVPRGVRKDLVGVRTLLAFGDRAAALVCEYAGGRAERTVGEHGQGGDAAGAVVGGDHMAARERDMGGAVAVDRPELPEGPRNIVADVEGRRRTLPRLAHRVEDRTLGAPAER